jgi:glycerate kinase
MNHMHILICPNAFKNSLDAEAAAQAIEEGIQQSRLSCTTECFPIGDGGDGTGKLLTQLRKGTFINETVHDPLGKKITASFGLIDDGQTAVIEMASASGLRLLGPDELDPMHASSYGTGELIIKALNKGVTKILLCVGGSGTVDGGCGILRALGIRFLDGNKNELDHMPKNLVQLVSVDLSGLDKRIRHCECVILCDVINTLLGENGAARIFGPQKGASADDVLLLEASLAQFNNIVLQTTGITMADLLHGGAAGGVAAGLHALLGAKLVNGIDHFLDIIGFDSALQKTDLVITGEGSIDLQTLEGKGPYGVALRARQKSIPVIALAGKVPGQDYEELNVWFDVLLAIGNEPTAMETAILSTPGNLVRSARQIGKLLMIHA